MLTTDNILNNARSVLTTHWDELLELRLKVLKSWEQEDIHDLRVASRRFRVVLDLLQPFCCWRDMNTVSREVRRLTRALGELRNLDEARTFWQTRLAVGGQLEQILAQLGERREQERQAVVRRLKKFSPKKLTIPVTAAAAAMGGNKRNSPPFPVYLAEVSLNRFTAVVSWLPAAVDFPRRMERHNLRISIKKWRYFLEIVASVSGQQHDDVLELLKKYQTLLGGMNDLAVFGEMSRAMPAGREETERILMAEEKALFEQFQVLSAAEPLRYVFRL